MLGAGNRMRGDDGAGSLLAGRLRGCASFPCFDGGCAPENFLEKVVAANPDAILIADAADFQGRPGEARLFGPEALAGGGISTHAVSFKMICDYLNFRLPGARIFFLAIQPESAAFGEGLSPAVGRTVDEAVKLLKELF